MLPIEANIVFYLERDAGKEFHHVEYFVESEFYTMDTMEFMFVEKQNDEIMFYRFAMPEDKAAQRAKNLADKYGVTVEDLKEVGVDTTTEEEIDLTDEQFGKIRDKYVKALESVEENVLNDVSYDVVDNVGMVRSLQFVDRLAPNYNDLMNEYIPKYLTAEVKHIVDGQEKFSIELIPITWQESFIPAAIDLDAIMAGDARPDI